MFVFSYSTNLNSQDSKNNKIINVFDILKLADSIAKFNRHIDCADYLPSNKFLRKNFRYLPAEKDAVQIEDVNIPTAILYVE